MAPPDPDDAARAGGAATEWIDLRHGRTLEIRPTMEADAEGICELYASLSDSDRYRRFFGAFVPRLEWCRTWATVGEQGGFGVVVVLHQNGTEQIVAEAAYALRADGDGDLAVTVAREWRGWVGPYLVDVLVRHAARHGVDNLQAEVLLENRPMLAILRARGAVDLEHPGMEVRLTIGTSGPVPSWPPADHRPKVLVEVAGGRWAGERPANDAGLATALCSGPERRHRTGCPVLDGGRCPLADGADVIVILLDPEAERTASLIAEHARLQPGKPILVASGPRGSVPAGCLSLPRNGDAVVAEVLSLLGRRPDGEPGDRGQRRAPDPRLKR